jgi:hypothetical protein
MMTPAASFSVSLFTAILLYSITGMAQSISIEEKTSDIVPATDTKSIDSFEKPIDPATEVTPEAAATGILKSPRMPDLSVFESLEEHDMRDDKYVASVDLAGLIWPEDGFGKAENLFGRVILGLKRPYYRLGENIRLAGLVDLNAAGSLGGLGNSATVTFRYDLRRNHDEHSVRMSVFFVYISYKISIPFGG